MIGGTWLNALTSVLRPSSSGVVAGWLGIAVAMLSFWLAIVALGDDKKVTTLSLLPLFLAIVIVGLSMVALVYLAIRAETVRRRTKVVKGAMNLGNSLRGGIRSSVMSEEQIRPWLEAWCSEVASWIANEEPDYHPDFEVAGGEVMFTFSAGFATAARQG